jgi:hypothetical protein
MLFNLQTTTNSDLPTTYFLPITNTFHSIVQHYLPVEVFIDTDKANSCAPVFLVICVNILSCFVLYPIAKEMAKSIKEEYDARLKIRMCTNGQNSLPTTCPNDVNHTIDPAMTVGVSRVEESIPLITVVAVQQDAHVRGPFY